MKDIIRTVLIGMCIIIASALITNDLEGRAVALSISIFCLWTLAEKK